jgi:hypothetical protein
MKMISAQPLERRGGQGTAANHCFWRQFPALLSPFADEPRVLTQYSKIEIPNETFVLDTHWPFICSAAFWTCLFFTVVSENCPYISFLECTKLV